MADARHKAQTPAEGIHTPIAFEYPDAATRLAAGPFESYDKNKLAFQVDSGEIFLLSDISGPTWLLMSSPSGAADHGGLTGLLDDDHPQYLRVDGYRAMSGDLDMGGNDLNNIGNIDGINLSLHADRHELGGADEIDGYQLGIIYNPINYNSPVNDILGEHLSKIDEALGSSGVTDHGALTGLSDDDHTQYLLVNGSRAMSGDLNLDGNDIINVATVDGVDVSDHSSRHENGGADEISVTGLSGLLADPQTPTTHASSHLAGGSDELDGYNIEVNFNPGHYTDPTNNLLGQHLYRIDEAIGEVLSDIITDHGALSGLSDDDHTQYLLANGTRAMSGNLNLGTNNITNVGTVDGVDVSTHAARHENGGADEISVQGLSGLLADPQTPLGHNNSHESGGSDEIDGYNIEIVYNAFNYNQPVNNLIGEHIAKIDESIGEVLADIITDHGGLTGLSDDDHTQYLLANGTRAMSGALNMGTNNITNVGTVDGVDISDHSSRHENGGADEIDVTGLSGLLADPQTPLLHASSHESGGTDELDGYQIELVYNPINYLAPINDLIGEHIARIDDALSSVSGSVSSVFGRVGDVVAEDGDYNSDQITNSSSVGGITVSDALETLNALIVGGGGGTVSGPDVTTDNAIARWSGSDGYTIQNSGIIIDDFDNITGVASINSVVIESHAARHESGGDDEIDGYQLAIVYNPANYLAPINDILGEHLFRIDEALGTIIFDHGDLVGLGDDDHTQYLLANGTRSMSGDLNMGGNDINNVATVDGVDVSDHSSRHENGGADEISVAGLSGLLADAQTPLSHASSHLAGGADELDGYNIEVNFNPGHYTDPTNNLLGQHLYRIDEAIGEVLADIITDHGALTGLLDDDHTQYLLANGTRAMSGALDMGTNNITNVGTVDGVDISDHSARHENGGADEISVVGLSGLLADPQTPLSHSSSHLAGGSDELDGYNIEVNFNPGHYTDPTNNLLGQHLYRIDEAIGEVLADIITDHGALTGLSDDDHTQYLLVNGSRAMSGDLDMGGNDINNVATVDGVDISDHSARHENGGADEISVTGLSGLLADPQTPLSHASSHLAGGGDELDGYNIEVNYNPSNYTDPTNNLLGQHLYRIDEALASSGGVTDHGALTGLSDDDHTQYLLVNGSRAMSGDLDLNNNDIVNIKTAVFDEFDNGNSGSSINIDWNNSQKQRIRLTNDVTFSFTNPLGVGNFVLVVEQDGTGGRNIIWPAEARAPNSSVTIFGTPNSVSLLSLYYDADGYYNINSSPYLTGPVSTDVITEFFDFELHATRHEAGGDDEIDGYQLAIVYNPINYNSPVNDILGEHLSKIDEALASSGGVTDHGALTGLSDDDHTQYLLVNGTRAMSGDLDMDGNDIIDVGTVDGVDVSDHSSRHENGGADEIDVTGLSGLLADPQTPAAHASSHLAGGGDELDGYNIEVNFNPSHYTDPTNNLLGQHLYRIDEAIGEVLADIITDHGGLTGLSDDDHTQYLLANGSRAMSGDLDMGGNDINNVATVDGVDVSNHSSRHESGGADEIDGYNLAIVYIPSNYANPINDILGEHLSKIDEAFDSYMPISGGTVLGSINMNSNDISNIDVATNDSEHDMGNQAGASLTLNANNGNFQRLTLTGNITSITMTAPTSGIGRFQFKFIQDGSGGRTVTGWPGSVLWLGGSDPTFSTGIGDIDIVSLYYDGTNWFGVFGGDFS